MNGQNKIKELKAAVASLDEVSTKITQEKARIVNSFIDLLRWVDRNVPREVTLPLNSKIASGGVFKCSLNDDEVEIYLYSTQPPRLTNCDEALLLRLVDLGFADKLREKIQGLATENKKRLQTLSKVTVPREV